MRTIPFRYLLYGWIVASERALPLLVPVPSGQRAPDVTIRFAPVAMPPQPVLVADRDLNVYSEMRAVYAPRPELRFLVEDGCRIVADVPATLSDAALHTWLFGPPMAWLCHQRGCPPLHACVVQIGDHAVALAGDSGAGKSTTARALIARGHGLLTDDQAVIDPDTLLVHPGYPSIKLWAGAAASAGDSLHPELRIHAAIDKFHVPQPQAFRMQPARLSLIVVLSLDRSAVEPRFKPASWQEAAAILQRLIYRTEAGRSLGGGRRGFDWTLAVARKVAVMTLVRPDDPSALSDMCAQFERLAEAAAMRGGTG